MNVLVLNGSPRKNGNISAIVDEVCRGLKKNGHSIESFFLSDLSIRDCTGCMSCQEKGACIIRDDIEKVEQGIIKSDLMIIGTPVHWGNISGITLRVFERLFGFLIQEMPYAFPIARHAKGKKAIIVTSCSTIRPFNFIFNQSRSAFSRLSEICKYSGIKIVEKFVLSGTIKKAKASERDKMKAFNIGTRF